MKKIVHQQKQTTNESNKNPCFAGRTKFFCGPHVHHHCSRQSFYCTAVLIHNLWDFAQKCSDRIECTAMKDNPT